MTAPRRLVWCLRVISVCALLLVPRMATAQLSALVSPGPLHKVHASISGVDQCLQCHSKGQQVAAEKCLVCHKPVAARIAAKKGVHRAVTTDCVTCHVEHAGVSAELRPFDQKTFDHARDTGFPLTGLHAPVAAKCEACHKTRSFLQASPSCVTCHADPHKNALGPTCTSCHSTAVKFTAATRSFDHSKTKFPLVGAHTKVVCDSCHKNKPFKGIPFATCASCHADPHKTKMGSACASCHTEVSWQTSKMNHSRTAFPLTGKHATVACVKCHVRPAGQVKVAFATCETCHADPHKGSFREDCVACHTVSGFAGGKFDHAKTTFALADKHAGLTCVACHKSATRTSPDFRGLTTTCQSCHTDVHKGELGVKCESCHTAKTFLVPAFTHANPRPFFAGQHTALTCTQCHVKTMAPGRTAGTAAERVGFVATGTTCASCHKDPHLGQFTQTCETCHAVDVAKFVVSHFNHALTTFALTGKHTAVACEKCHVVATGAFPSGAGTAKRFKGVGTTCASCHEDPHSGQLDRACVTCHTVETFSLPKYEHRNAKSLRSFFTGRHVTACANCHKPVAGASAGAKASANYAVTTTCTSCHADPHRGALGPDCASCHKP